MSALGHKLPRRCRTVVSAIPPKAAAADAEQRVRFGPLSDIGGGAGSGCPRACRAAWEMPPHSGHIIAQRLSIEL
jgi:hypothetical protein